jgi:hypothetical protein
VSKAVKTNDPRVIAYMQILDRVDALRTVNDPQALPREADAVVAQLGEVLKMSGIAPAVEAVFTETCPVMDIKNGEQVATFQRASAELVHKIMSPVMPGTSGAILTINLQNLSMGDDAPVLRRTHVRNQRLPNSLQYTNAKALLVYRCAYEAAFKGENFIPYLADHIPGGMGGDNFMKNVERDWAHADFVDKDKREACRAAGTADRNGIPLTDGEAVAKAEATLHSIERLMKAVADLSKAIR